MTLMAPAFLWALAAVPIILLLHLLRVRRTSLPVSSVLLWRSSSPAFAVLRPVRRLERTILLVLQVVAAASLAMGLARPAVVRALWGGEALALVLDGSMSMEARDVPPTRFERARREAVTALQRLGAGREVAVLLAAPRPLILAPLSADVRGAQAALHHASPWDGVGDLAGTVALARSLAPQGRLRVLVWTDGAHGMLPTFPDVEYHLVGTSSENVGITAFRVLRDPEHREALLRLQNFGDRDRDVPVVVREGGVPTYQTTVHVGPGHTEDVTVPVEGTGVLEARLVVDDALPQDNVAQVLPGPDRLPSVLLVGSPDPDLIRLLRAAPLARVEVTSSVDPASLSGFNVVILNRIAPPELPPGNYLVVGAVPGGLPLEAEGVLRDTAPAAWDPTDPLLRFVDLSRVHVAQALRLRPWGGRTVVAGQGPLLWTYEGGGVRVVLLAFSIDHSDLSRHVAFPILFTNILLWLGGTPLDAAVGDQLQLPSEGRRIALLVTPDGRRLRVPGVGGMLVLPPFQRAGVYRLVQDGQTTLQVAVHPGSAEAGRIRPGRAPAAAPPAERGRLQRSPQEMGPLLLLVGLGALLGEWALAMRLRGGER